MIPTALNPLQRRHAPSGRVIGIPPEQGDTPVSALYANGTRRADKPAMRYLTPAGDWEVITWGEYLLAARQVAGGLAALGVQPGEKVAILSDNRPEWYMADLGSLLNGSVTVPIYTTSSAQQIAYLLGHSEASVCFVDTHGQLGKVLEVADELPALRHLVVTVGARRAGDAKVISLDELRAIGADRLARDPLEVDQRARQVRAEDLATISYTSGTTGPPKGVMLSHGNVMSAMRSVTPVLEVGEGERLLSFLPLSHIAERMTSELPTVAVGGETWFARSLATVAEDLKACRPTVFLAVPRVWQKLREGVEHHLSTQPAVMRAAVGRYIDLGLRKVDAEQGGAPMPRAAQGVYEALDLTVGATIRAQLGLDQARVLITTAAPTHPDLIRWFHAIGLKLLQLYGQTESSGPTTSNFPDNNRIGTVGTAFPGMIVKLADDGEILLRGGNVCLGYFKDPEATAELIDEQGWMHSGDTGAFDPDGSLRVIGRKKDLIITAAGKNIAPQDIEVDLCNHPLVSEAVVVGEGRRYLTALVTLDAEELSRWAQSRDKLEDVEALSSDPDVLAEIQALVDTVNAKRSHAEGIRKFKILPHELTASAGELTPTRKVKRAVVYERYAEVIDDLYANG